MSPGRIEERAQDDVEKHSLIKSIFNCITQMTLIKWSWGGNQKVKYFFSIYIMPLTNVKANHN